MSEMTTSGTSNTQDALQSMKLDVRVRPIEPKGNLLAFASVKINDCFAVNDIKVVTGEKGMFINMPSAPDGKGGYKDVCLPTTTEFHKQLSEAVLDGYAAAIDKMQTKVQAAERVQQKPSVQRQLQEGAVKSAQTQAQAAPAAPRRAENAL